MLSDLFRTSTMSARPQDGMVALPAVGQPVAEQPVAVSDFLTVQALANFSVMTGAIFAAWHALQLTGTWADNRWLPLTLCGVYGEVAYLITDKEAKQTLANVIPMIFVAIVNVLVLFSAVVGLGAATGLK